jgi:hypothetical protein
LYYSLFGEMRPIPEIPAVDHGENHSGTLFLDLNDEAIAPAGWVLQGEYWTNKRKDPHDDASKGTWGRTEMKFRRREPAPAAVSELRPEDQAWLKFAPSGKVPSGYSEDRQLDAEVLEIKERVGAMFASQNGAPGAEGSAMPRNGEKR